LRRDALAREGFKAYSIATIENWRRIGQWSKIAFLGDRKKALITYEANAEISLEDIAKAATLSIELYYKLANVLMAWLDRFDDHPELMTTRDGLAMARHARNPRGAADQDGRTEDRRGARRNTRPHPRIRKQDGGS
jgi:hypothetical protein